MSLRDVMWVCLYLNELVGSSSSCTRSNVMKSLTLLRRLLTTNGDHSNT